MSQNVKRVDPLDKLLASASADALRSLVKQLTTGGGNWEEGGRSPSDIRRECLEYLKKKVLAGLPGKETSDSESLWDLWGELEPDLAELDNYGGGEYSLQDHVGELLLFPARTGVLFWTRSSLISRATTQAWEMPSTR
jgi:hypothetical protein